MLGITKTWTSPTSVEVSVSVPTGLVPVVEQTLVELAGRLSALGLFGSEGQKRIVSGALEPKDVLRHFRTREGWTQAELAKQLKTKQQHISEMENGKRDISIKTAKGLAKLFGTPHLTFL